MISGREILEIQGHVVYLYNQRCVCNCIICFRIFQNILSIHIASNESFKIHVKKLRTKIQADIIMYELFFFYYVPNKGNVQSNSITFILAILEYLV